MGALMTVTGPVDAGELGFTLTHEHLFINLLREYRGNGLLNDELLAIEECQKFAALGGRTIVDCTNGSMGRDPEALRRVAEATGLNIVMGCGHYRVPYLDHDWLDAHPVDEIAESIVIELTEGIGDDHIRPGVIGEIGADKWFISAHEERSFRAAARASIRTGVTVTTHAARWPVGQAQLDLLLEEGMDPTRIIVGHCDTVPVPDYPLSIAERGAYVQFDNIRGLTEYDLVRQASQVVRLRDAGHLDKVLLSHDVCLRTHLSISGGPGFELISKDFLPRLLRVGLTEDEIRMVTHDNPARALAGR